MARRAVSDERRTRYTLERLERLTLGGAHPLLILWPQLATKGNKRAIIAGVFSQAFVA